MGNFQRGGNGGGGFRGGDRGGNGGGRGGFQKKSWGGDSRGGDRDRGPVTMHRATCGDCGQSCEVPFRPNGDKPVFCNNCFNGKKDSGDRGGRSDFGSREPRREFNDRPSHTSSFSKSTSGNDDLKKQLSEMNTKLERVVNLLEKFTKVKGDTPVAQGEPVIVVKAEKKTPSLKTLIKKAVEPEVSKKKAPAKKVVAKKK